MPGGWPTPPQISLSLRPPKCGPSIAESEIALVLRKLERSKAWEIVTRRSFTGLLLPLRLASATYFANQPLATSVI